MQFLLSICVSALSFATQLQQPSLLDMFRQKSPADCVLVSYEFTTVQSGITLTGEGTVEIQGNSYHMLGNEIEIFCDGTSTWMIDGSAKEVIVEDADSKDAGYLANPVLLLMNLEKAATSCKVEGNKVIISLADGTPLEIVVTGLETMETKKPEAFRPPTEFGSDWIVTDLR